MKQKLKEETMQMGKYFSHYSMSSLGAMGVLPYGTPFFDKSIPNLKETIKTTINFYDKISLEELSNNECFKPLLTFKKKLEEVRDISNLIDNYQSKKGILIEMCGILQDYLGAIQTNLTEIRSTKGNEDFSVIIDMKGPYRMPED